MYLIVSVTYVIKTLMNSFRQNGVRNLKGWVMDKVVSRTLLSAVSLFKMPVDS
jgi:hypothetical protein